MTDADQTDRPPVGRQFVVLFLLWAGSYLAAGRVLETGRGGGWRLAAILVPAGCFLAWMAEAVRYVRSRDERERRIQFDGLAVSLPATILLLMVLGQLDAAGQRPVPLRYLFVVPIIVHAVAAAVARRRYA